MSDLEADASLALLETSDELKYLAKSFSVTGNTRMADKLYTLAHIVFESNKTIQGEHAKFINDRLEAAQQGTANMLNACMAGITIGKESANG